MIAILCTAVSISSVFFLPVVLLELSLFKYQDRLIKDMQAEHYTLYIQLLQYYPQLNTNLQQHTIAELLVALETLQETLAVKIEKACLLTAMPNYQNNSLALLAHSYRFFKSSLDSERNTTDTSKNKSFAKINFSP